MEIITLKFNDIEIQVCPSRGGIITSLSFGGTEILYQDMLDETLYNNNKSVRGGIPYLFPNAGPLEEVKQQEKGWNLSQHGFARNSSWELKKQTQSGLVLGLKSSDVTKNIFPYDFEILQKIEIIEGGVKISHEIKNLSKINMPISTGLHPYFSAANKEGIKILSESGNQIEKQINKWGNDQMVSFSTDGKLEFYSSGVGNIELDVSDDYKNFWIRSLSGKNFVCFEPVMNNYGGLTDSPVFVEPGKVNINYMKIKLKK